MSPSAVCPVCPFSVSDQVSRPSCQSSLVCQKAVSPSHRRPEAAAFWQHDVVRRPVNNSRGLKVTHLYPLRPRHAHWRAGLRSVGSLKIRPRWFSRFFRNTSDLLQKEIQQQTALAPNHGKQKLHRGPQKAPLLPCLRVERCLGRRGNEGARSRSARRLYQKPNRLARRQDPVLGQTWL